MGHSIFEGVFYVPRINLNNPHTKYQINRNLPETKSNKSKKKECLKIVKKSGVATKMRFSLVPPHNGQIEFQIKQ